jgi:hypothetical protein
MLMRAFIRNVWLLNVTPSAGAGVVAHVPTQCIALVMIPVWTVTYVQLCHALAASNNIRCARRNRDL